MTKNTKRTIQIIILIFLLCAGIYLFLGKNVGSSYNNLITDDKTINGIVSSRTFCDTLFSSIMFNDEELLYDANGDYYFYSLIQGSSHSYNPEVNVISDSSDLKIVFNSSISSDDIANNNAISFVVYNDSYYYSSALKCTTLPVISINTDSDIPESKEESTTMKFQIYDNSIGASERVITSDGTIHVRGASSLIYPKKSYRLSLSYTQKNGNVKNNKVSLLGLRKDEDWILYCIYDDPEKVRNIFSTNLWKNSVASDNNNNLDTGTEYKYVELFLNGEYSGLYALGYPMQATQIGITKDNANAVMYRRLMGYENTLLLESDGAPSSFRIQSKHDNDSFSLLREYLIQTDMFHDKPDELKGLIDIDNAIDFYLYINLIQGWDNIYKNQNLAIFNGNNSLKGLYIPWDMDLTWGSTTHWEKEPITTDTNFEFNYEAFYELLQLEPETTISQIQKKYKKLRQTTWSDATVLTMLDSYEKDIFSSGAYLRERDCWPEGSYIDGLQLNLDEFKDYVLDRLSAMDDYVDNLTADSDYEYEKLTFGSDIIYDCVSQLFSDPNELVLLEINNPSLWNEEYYYKILSKWGIPSDYVSEKVSLKSQLIDQYNEFNGESIAEDALGLGESTDLIIMLDNDEFSYCNNFFAGGTYETEIGNLICYQADDGSCGIYLDDKEIITENAFDRDFDLRVIHIDADSHEVTRIEEHKVYEE